MADNNTISFSEVRPGDKIKFFVLDTNNVISGTVQAIANYSVAKSMQTDIASRHASMQAANVTNNTIGEINIIDDLFIILDIGETRPTVIASSWINNTIGIQRIDKCNDYKIILKNCTKADATRALHMLRASNIPCSFDPLN